MFSLLHRLVPRSTVYAAFAIGLVVVSPLGAQDVTIHSDARDSASWIVPRAELGDAELALRTSDRLAAILLMDSTIVLQLTNRGLNHVSHSADTVSSLGARLVGRMVMAGVMTLLDHGIAYRLDALGEVRSEGSRLVLVDRKGKRVFNEMDVNGRQVLESFEPDEAERFAVELNRAIRRRR